MEVLKRRRIPAQLPAVIVLGIVSQVGQALFIRELLMVFQGSELSIGLILAAWMIWVGVGSRLGAKLIDRFQCPLLFLVINSSGISLSLPVSLLLMRLIRVFLNVLPGTNLTLVEMVLVCFVLTAPSCVFFGAQYILLARVWRDTDQVDNTSGASKTYIGEAAGNMLGGLMFTFLMVRYLNSFQSAFVAVLFLLAALLILIWRHQNQVRWYRYVFSVMLVVSAFMLFFSSELDNRVNEKKWKQIFSGHQLVETLDSKHGTISVIKKEDQISFFQAGHLVFSIASTEATSPAFEEQEAVVFAHFAMVQHENPKRVLLMGGGLRGLLSEMLKHPVEHIDYIELDEVLTTAAWEHISEKQRTALLDSKVNLIHADGRLFMKSAVDKYDMIIIDVPDPVTAVLNRYYTIEFFQEAEALLTPKGVIVLGTTSTSDLRGTAVANRNTTIFHSLQEIFSYVFPVGDRFLFFVCSNVPDQISVDDATLAARYLERKIKTDGFSAEHFSTILEASQLQRINWILRNHGRSEGAHLAGPGRVPMDTGSISDQIHDEMQLSPVERKYFINSDLKPIGYFYSLMFLDDLTRSGHADVLYSLLNVQLWWVVPLFGVPVLIITGIHYGKKVKEKTYAPFLAVLYTVFTTGFSTMTLQIALLFSFQAIYGFVYEMVGLIVAFFMCGLALGALLSHRYIGNKCQIELLAGVQLFIAGIAGLIAITLPGVTGIRSPGIVFVLFALLTFIAGIINGVDFPLASSCIIKYRAKADRAASSVYSIELFGACLGSVLASVVFAPILGIIACCLIGAVANLTAFAGLVITRSS